MIIIKFGGAAITNKEVYRELNEGALVRLADAVALIKEPVIIVHGAGSFGHKKVKETGVGKVPYEDGMQGDASQISTDMRELNHCVLKALRDAGLSPISFPPSAMITSAGKEMDHLDVVPMEMWAEKGFIIVSFGDLVRNSETGISIVSGDELMFILGELFDARMAVFCSDQDGIYDKPPLGPWEPRPGSELIEVVHPDTEIAFDVDNVNETGSAEEKLKWMFKLAGIGIDTWWVSGRDPDRLLALVNGEGAVGSRIDPERLNDDEQAGEDE